MQLIGMLDSPYVRRVAVSMNLLGLRYEHQSLSVFRNFDAFAAINPVVKAPSLVCDDGEVLMDSSLILDYAETLSGRSLMPDDVGQRQHALRLIGLGLVASEKAVQVVYERQLRPEERRHAPWMERVQQQLRSACSLLDGELRARALPPPSGGIDQAGVTVAVAWSFIQLVVGDVVDPAAYEAIAGYTAAAEALPAFRSAPVQ